MLSQSANQAATGLRETNCHPKWSIVCFSRRAMRDADLSSTPKLDVYCAKFGTGGQHSVQLGCEVGNFFPALPGLHLVPFLFIASGCALALALAGDRQNGRELKNCKRKDTLRVRGSFEIDSRFCIPNDKRSFCTIIQDCCCINDYSAITKVRRGRDTAPPQ